MFEKQKCIPLTLEGGLQIVPTSGGEGVKQNEKKKQKNKKQKPLYSYNFTDYNFFFGIKTGHCFLIKYSHVFISSIYKR